MHNPAHPGELLYELVLHPLELTLTEAARRLGVSRHTLSRLVHTQTSLTPEMALRLELTFGTPDAAHWLRLQNAHDLWKARLQTHRLQVQPVAASVA